MARRSSTRPTPRNGAGQRNGKPHASTAAPRPPRRRTPTRAALAKLPDDDLLALRLCDLPDELERTPVAPRVRRLYDELDRRGIHFRPHVWFSSEWFSPDGTPGIAIPFYLIHKRLMRLERREMLQVEGGSDAACMKILRHEAGHCLDTAYRLHYRRRWRELFGPYTQKYPDSYQPRPTSRQFVLHLDMWYAQAHPAEDFAETFAVWLSGPQQWRHQYAGWPALRKLEYVDELMHEIGHKPAPVRSRAHVESIADNRMTLREHYRRKRLYYLDEWPDFYDADLLRIFSADERFAAREPAVSFLRRVSPELRRIVSKWSGEHQYTIDQVLQDMIDRCKELRLRVALPSGRATTEALVMLTVQTMNFIHTTRHRVML